MYTVSDRFHSAVMEGKPTTLRLRFFEGDIGPEHISSSGLNYSSMAFDGEDLTIGAACSAELDVTLINHDGTLSGYDFDGTEFAADIGVLIDDEYEWVPLGVFISEKPDRLRTTLISLSAHDRMIKFDVEADSFLSSLTYPVTLKGVFHALCGHVGVPYVDGDFPNAGKTFGAAVFVTQEVLCREILQWIAEAAGCFARINRKGECELAWFSESGVTFTKTPEWADYFAVAVSEYAVAKIDKLQVAGSESDIGVIVGPGANGYQIVDNPFLYGYSDAHIRPYAEVIYDRLAAFPVYIPVEMDAVGDWAIEPGDIITVQTDDGDISMPVFSVDMEWSGSPRIQYVNSGSPTRPVMSAENRRKLQAGRAMNEIEQTVEGLRQTVSKTVFLTPVLSDTDPSTEWENPAEYEGYQWFDGTNTRVWDGGKWLLVVNPDFTQTTRPTAVKVGQYWYNPSTKLVSRWDGATWLVDNTLTIPQTWAQTMQTNLEVTAEELSAEISSTQGSVTALRATVNGISTEVSNTQGRVTALNATVNGISTEVSKKVGKSEVISSINQSAEAVTIKANKIALEGTVTANSNFKILTNGSMEAVNGKFTGTVNANSGSFTGSVYASSGTIGGFTIQSNRLEGSSLSLYSSYGNGYIELGSTTLQGYGAGIIGLYCPDWITSGIRVQAPTVYGDVVYVGNYSYTQSSYIPNCRIDTDNGMLYRTSHSNSSIRYKKDVRECDDSWRGIYELKPVIYKYKDDAAEREMYGLIAEDVAKIMPMLVEYVTDNHGNKYPDNVDYSRLTAPILMALQDINERLTRLEEKLNGTEQDNNR